MGKMPKTALLGRFWFAIKTIRQRESDMGRNERDIYKNFSKVFDRDDVLQSPRRAEKKLAHTSRFILPICCGSRLAVQILIV